MIVANTRPQLSSMLPFLPDFRMFSFLSYVAALITSDTRRSEEHTSELQSLMRISYAVFCLKKKNKKNTNINKHNTTKNKTVHFAIHLSRELSKKYNIYL